MKIQEIIMCAAAAALTPAAHKYLKERRILKMKKTLSIILALCMLAGLATGSLGVLAETASVSDPHRVLTEDFASKDACQFLAPGDIDANGIVNAEDLAQLRQMLLKDEESKYSDVNGDESVDIRDLIRLKRNIANNDEFIANGVMSLNGSSAFKGAFTGSLCENAEYEIKLIYRSDAQVTVKLADLDKKIIFDAASESSTEVRKTFTTPESITDEDNIDFQIIGIADIEYISVTRIGVDNDVEFPW